MDARVEEADWKSGDPLVRLAVARGADDSGVTSGDFSLDICEVPLATSIGMNSELLLSSRSFKASAEWHGRKLLALECKPLVSSALECVEELSRSDLQFSPCGRGASFLDAPFRTGMNIRSPKVSFNQLGLLVSSIGDLGLRGDLVLPIYGRLFILSRPPCPRVD